jgi:hypothetical protein
MSVTRRQFLLSTAGAAVGAIVPSFYFRALEFCEQFGKPLLETPDRAVMDLCVTDTCEGHMELSIGDPFTEIPPMTYREYFERVDPRWLDDYETSWGIEKSDLDTRIHEEYLWDLWFLHEGPQARAYHLLQSLDLGLELSGPEAVGSLRFVKEANMVGSWVSARVDDGVTLSLLQRRLNDLGTGIRVLTGYSL